MQAPGPGEVIAEKFRIERVLGQGGMGVVLAATHLQLGHEVAIKCLLPEVAQQPETLARFVQEARTCARLRSENIVRVHDVGTLPSGAPFIVMELLDGLDLAEHLARRGPLPIDEVVGYLRDVCEGLAVAHAAGIVHRDLKPSNLFVVPRPSGARGTVKILDFGISKLLDPPPAAVDSLGRTASNGMLGTPYYMAPEQILDPGSVTGQTDLWSLGVVLVELCSGVRPFVGDTAPALLGKILSEQPVPLRVLRPDAPAWLEATVARCLQKDPSRRPASAAALARELGGGSDPFGATALGPGPAGASGGWPVAVGPTSAPGSGGSHAPDSGGSGPGGVPPGPSAEASGAWSARPSGPSWAGGPPAGSGSAPGAPPRREASSDPELPYDEADRR
ncbi:MAG: serine/threonine protein kinase, partial [Myxococcales bacterium]